MTVRYLFDECFSPKMASGLRRRDPSLEVAYVGKDGVLPKETPDSDVLIWIEENEYHLVTNNRHSIPGHLVEHLTSGRHIPGAFQVPVDWSYDQIYTELLLIAGASFPGEYADRLVHFPVK
jgi:hypothetical protein